MSQIFKYEIINEALVTMPKGSTVLKVGVQGGSIFMWATVDVEANLCKRRFEVYPTGAELIDEDELHYIDTVFFVDWGTVFHVFERGDPK